MIRSSSSPCLAAIHNKQQGNAAKPMRKSVSVQALHDPTSFLEHVGFHSVVHASVSTVVECSLAAHTTSFPEVLVASNYNQNYNQALDVATCIATPSEFVEPFEKVIKNNNDVNDMLRNERIAMMLRQRRKRLSMAQKELQPDT